jgi:hypothetical protein
MHLLTCASCRGELAALGRTAALITQVGLEAAPDQWAAVRQRLVLRDETMPRSVAIAMERRRLRRAALEPGRRFVARPRLRLAYAVAAAAFVALVVFFGGLLRSSRMTSRPVATPVVRAEEEVQASVEGHLAASWSSPLGDEAALGLRMAAVEGEG